MAGSARDIVVIGGSAGALEALRLIVGELAADFPAAVFVVLHTGRVSYLPEVLAGATSLPVVPAASGSPIEHGRIHVAVPGAHLLLHDDHLLLRRGPRENLARPAIDVLFRSAAATFGSRVVGVVLSGSLSDGAAGLRAIKRCGGLAVVQEPADAMVPSMPEAAVRHVTVDHRSRAADMGRLLARLATEPAGPSPQVPLDIRLETAIAAQELADMRANDQLGKPSRFTCPECHGALWEIEDGTMLRFRCHVGHAFSAESVCAAQSDRIETMLGTLQRAHQERAALMRRLAERERAENRHGFADRLDVRAVEYEEDARLLFELMQRGFAGPAGATNENERDLPEHDQSRRGPARNNALE